MKKIIITFVAWSVTVISCSLTQTVSEKTARKIVGRWEISQIESSEYKMADAKSYGEKLMHEMSTESYFLFNADGTFRMKYGETEKSGRWLISPDGAKMIRIQNSVTDTLDILPFEKTKFTLKGKKNKAEIVIFLEKVK